jgi:hypothetical protein
VDQADRNVERLLQVAAEEVGDAGEAADSVGAALDPLAAQRRLRLVGGLARHGE